MTSPSRPIVDDQLDLRGFLAVMRRQIALILQVLVAVALLTALYLSLTPRAYTATALLRVDPMAISLVEASGGTSSAQSSRIDTEVEILRSGGLALRTISAQSLLRDPDFGPRLGMVTRMKTALGWDAAAGNFSKDAELQHSLLRFSEALAVRRIGLTEIISVSVTTANPDRAAAIANAHAEGFIQDQIDSKHRAAQAAREVMEAELAATRLRFQSAEADLQRTRESIAETGNAEAARATRLAVESAFARDDWQGIISELESDSLAALVRQRENLRNRLSGELAPELSADDLRATLDAVERQLDQELQSALSALDFTAQTGFASDSALTDLYSRQQEAVVARRQYEQVLGALRELEARAALHLADGRIVSPALPPLSASSPRVMLVVSVAVFMGIGLAIAGALLKEYHFGGITSVQQLRNVLATPVAASVPLVRLPGADDVAADLIDETPLSPFAESFRRLRAAIDLQLPRQKGAATVIMVTSAFAGEGKSTAALSLARTYAAAGQRCLLIDADFRNPSIHRLMRISPTRGLHDFLQAGAELEALADDDASNFYVPDRVAGLHTVLGANPSVIPTDTVLQSEGFRQLMQNARALFDVVILDTPPLMPVVDARYLAAMTDICLFCVRAGSTDQRPIREAFQELPDSHWAIMSVLMGGESRKESYSGKYNWAA